MDQAWEEKEQGGGRRIGERMEIGGGGGESLGLVWDLEWGRLHRVYGGDPSRDS